MVERCCYLFITFCWYIKLSVVILRWRIIVVGTALFQVLRLAHLLSRRFQSRWNQTGKFSKFQLRTIRSDKLTHSSFDAMCLNRNTGTLNISKLCSNIKSSTIEVLEWLLKKRLWKFEHMDANESAPNYEGEWIPITMSRKICSDWLEGCWSADDKIWVDESFWSYFYCELRLLSTSSRNFKNFKFFKSLRRRFAQQPDTATQQEASVLNTLKAAKIVFWWAAVPSEASRKGCSWNVASCSSNCSTRAKWKHQKHSNGSAIFSRILARSKNLLGIDEWTKKLPEVAKQFFGMVNAMNT